MSPPSRVFCGGIFCGRLPGKLELRHLEQMGSDLEPVALGECCKFAAQGREIFRRRVRSPVRHDEDSPSRTVRITSNPGGKFPNGR